MQKKINFIVLSTNIYGAFDIKDMAGAVRVRNIFNPLVQQNGVSVSNLIMLDLFGIQDNLKTESINNKVDCLAIGFSSITHPISVLQFLKRGMKFIKQHKQKNAANIIYNYQYPDVRNFLLLLYARLKGYKIVFDFVEDKKHYTTVSFNDKIHQKLSLLFLKWLPTYTDAVFVISSHLITEIGKITKQKIPIYSLPISVDFNNLATNNVKKNDEPVNIFYGGSFAEKDGLQYLVEALEIIHNKGYNFKLLMSGKASPHKKDSLFTTIVEKPFVDYKGFLSTEAYFELLASADICCMTRVNSAFANAGFPFKLGEFLAAGKVIIASKIGDVENYLIHKESAYLVSPESTAQIVEGLEYCIQNLATLSNTMGANAKKVAEKNFNAANSSKYLLEKCIEISK